MTSAVPNLHNYDFSNRGEDFRDKNRDRLLVDYSQHVAAHYDLPSGVLN